MQNAITVIQNRDLGTDKGFIAKRLNSHVVELMNATVSPEMVSPDAMNQKGVKRIVQLANFAVSGNVEDFDAVTAFMVSAVLLTKQETITYRDAHFLCGLGIDEAQHVKGVSRAKLSRFLGTAGTAGTITAKVSRTTGKRGFFTALGITAKGDAHSFTLTPTAKQNPLLLAYAMQLEKMTDSALALIAAKQKGE
jgi:hypothetical protein